MGNCDLLSVFIKVRRKRCGHCGVEENNLQQDTKVRERNWTRVGRCSFHSLRLSGWRSHYVIVCHETNKAKKILVRRFLGDKHDCIPI